MTATTCKSYNSTATKNQTRPRISPYKECVLSFLAIHSPYTGIYGNNFNIVLCRVLFFTMISEVLKLSRNVILRNHTLLLIHSFIGWNINDGRSSTLVLFKSYQIWGIRHRKFIHNENLNTISYTGHRIVTDACTRRTRNTNRWHLQRLIRW